METVRQLLIARRIELEQGMLLAIERASKPFRTQLHQVDVALSALDNVSQISTHSSQVTDWATEPKSRRALTRSIGLTLKDMIIMVLSVRQGSADALTILGEINERWSLELPRTSLSPQLSRLKQEGKLTLAGKVWSLAGLGQEAETPASET